MHRSRMGLLTSALVAALLLGLVGGANAATVEVHLVNTAFSPARVTINASDTVVFINDDPYDHDVLFEDGFGSGPSGSLHPGTNWSHTFDTNGTYRFRCQLHSGGFSAGMVGEVTVGTPPPKLAKTPGFEAAMTLLAAAGVALLVSRRARLP